MSRRTRNWNRWNENLLLYANPLQIEMNKLNVHEVILSSRIVNGERFDSLQIGISFTEYDQSNASFYK